MYIACVIVSVLLAFICLGMGSAQINGVPQVAKLLDHVGAKKIMTLSGRLLMLGATGLIAGLFWWPVGVAAAAGLILYFLIAAGFHIKIGDPIGQIINPLVPGAMAAVALWLRIASA